MIIKRKLFGLNDSKGLTEANANRNVASRNLIASKYRKELADAKKNFQYGHHDYNVYQMERKRIKSAIKSDASNSYNTILQQQGGTVTANPVPTSNVSTGSSNISTKPKTMPSTTTPKISKPQPGKPKIKMSAGIKKCGGLALAGTALVGTGAYLYNKGKKKD